VRENDTPPPYSTKLTLTSDNLVNLALGNAPGASVPTNQVLALVTGGGNGTRLIVFDTTSSNVVNEIGTFDGPVNGAVQTSTTKRQMILLLPIENLGSDAYGVDDGNLMVFGTQTLARDGSVTGVSPCTVSGWLDITVTDSGTGGTEEQSLVFSTGTMSFGKQLGTLVEPAPVIGLSTNTLSATATAGGPNPTPQSFTVCNNGPAGSVLNYTITFTPGTNTANLGESPPDVSPSSGTLASGQCQSTVVSISLNSTPAGTYTGTLTISDPDATNNPQTISGTLVVNP